MKTIALILAGLTLHLTAEEIDWGKRHKELSEENSRRFREEYYHDQATQQRERIHRESTRQRERIAYEQREQLERIERAIPRYPICNPGYRFTHGKSIFETRNP